MISAPPSTSRPASAISPTPIFDAKNAIIIFASTSVIRNSSATGIAPTTIPCKRPCAVSERMRCWMRMRSRIVAAIFSKTSVRLPPVRRAISMDWFISVRSSLPTRSSMLRSASSNFTPTRTCWRNSENSCEIGLRLCFTIDSNACRMLKPAFSALLIPIRLSTSCTLNRAMRRRRRIASRIRGAFSASRAPPTAKPSPRAMPAVVARSPKRR